MSTRFSTLLLLLLAPAFGSAAGSGLEAGEEPLFFESLEAPLVAYEGQIEVATPKEEGTERRLLTVRYAPPSRYKRVVTDEFGFPVLTVVSDGEVEWIYDRRRGTAWKGVPADADYKLIDPDEERQLLLANYTVTAAGSEKVAGRPCRVLEVRAKAGGGLVRKVWVDQEHVVILRRVGYRADGKETARMSFVDVSFPDEAEDWDFSFAPPEGVRVAVNRLQPDYLDFDEAAVATDMTPSVPAWLPPGYLFESMNLLPYRGATILHYRFTDGMDVLSLFQAPKRARVRYSGTMAAGDPGRTRLPLTAGAASLVLTADGKFLEWRRGDHFVLIGDIGVEALKRVAESLKPVETGS